MESLVSKYLSNHYCVSEEDNDVYQNLSDKHVVKIHSNELLVDICEAFDLNDAEASTYITKWILSIFPIFNIFSFWNDKYLDLGGLGGLTGGTATMSI